MPAYGSPSPTHPAAPAHLAMAASKMILFMARAYSTLTSLTSWLESMRRSRSLRVLRAKPSMRFTWAGQGTEAGEPCSLTAGV